MGYPTVIALYAKGRDARQHTAATVEAAEQALQAFAGSEVGRRCPAVVDV